MSVTKALLPIVVNFVISLILRIICPFNKNTILVPYNVLLNAANHIKLAKEKEKRKGKKKIMKLIVLLDEIKYPLFFGSFTSSCTHKAEKKIQVICL